MAPTPHRFELPDRNAYWDSIARGILCEFGMALVIVHGCAYGLVAKHGDNAGRPIKKPWRIATHNPVFASRITKRCVCSFEHAQCAGAETRGTGDYPIDLTKACHTLFKYIIQNDQMNHMFKPEQINAHTTRTMHLPQP